MIKNEVFLLMPPGASQRAFSAKHEAVESMYCGMFHVANNWDWRESALTPANADWATRCDILMVHGDWMDDNNGKNLIGAFHARGKAVVHLMPRLKRHLDSFCRTIRIQQVLNQHYPPAIIRGNVDGVKTTLYSIADLDLLRGKSRKREVVEARAIFTHVCREYLDLPFAEIGWLLNRNSSDIIHLANAFNDWYGLRGFNPFKEVADDVLSVFDPARNPGNQD